MVSEQWQVDDTWASVAFFHSMMRLKKGLRRFETVWEMYQVEAWGGIP